MPNLFVNSAEEGEINNSTENEPEEGNKNFELKPEEINGPQNNENIVVENEKITERKSERQRRRPNYYGTIKYC